MKLLRKTKEKHGVNNVWSVDIMYKVEGIVHARVYKE